MAKFNSSYVKYLRGGAKEGKPFLRMHEFEPFRIEHREVYGESWRNNSCLHSSDEQSTSRTLRPRKFWCSRSKLTEQRSTNLSWTTVWLTVSEISRPTT